MDGEPKIGDQVIFSGRLYWLAMVITMADQSVTFALRQAHWPKEFHLLVKRSEVMVDVPFTA